MDYKPLDASAWPLTDSGLLGPGHAHAAACRGDGRLREGEGTPMKAMVLTAYRRLEILDVPRPEPGPHDVLVRVRACGICGSDVHGYDGSSGRRIPPIVMGHEAAGVVEAVGPEVSRLPAGRPRHLRLDDLLRRVRVLPRRPDQPVRPPPGARRLAAATTAATARSRSAWRCPSASSTDVPDALPLRARGDGRAAVGRGARGAADAGSSRATRRSSSAAA